ncbi:MAG: DUF4215 domain-containing protein [Nannocystaceae bacterium]
MNGWARGGLALAWALGLSACGDDDIATSSTASATDGETTAMESATTEAETTAGPATTSAGSESGSDTVDTTTEAPTTEEPTTEEPTTEEPTTEEPTTDPMTDPTTTSDPVCGDGVVEGDEECDDGPANDDAGGCTTACVAATCGDGLVYADVEECDDGDANDDAGGCTTACLVAACGDGLVYEGVEECDDGDDNADNAACTSGCQAAACGDGLVYEGIEECDEGDANDDASACTTACLTAVCGDGLLYEGVEKCDDGNDIDDDECSNACEVNLDDGCPPGQVNLLVNHGFETGSLAPWVSDVPQTMITNFAHTGSWAAETNGNHYVQQTIMPVPVSSILQATFWSWHDGADSPLMAIWWGYSDNTMDQALVFQQDLQGWQQANFLANMNQAKQLQWVRAWGYSGGGPAEDITRFDDFLLCVQQ